MITFFISLIIKIHNSHSLTLYIWKYHTQNITNLLNEIPKQEWFQITRPSKNLSVDYKRYYRST